MEEPCDNEAEERKRMTEEEYREMEEKALSEFLDRFAKKYLSTYDKDGSNHAAALEYAQDAGYDVDNEEELEAAFDEIQRKIAVLGEEFNVEGRERTPEEEQRFSDLFDDLWKISNGFLAMMLEQYYEGSYLKA